MVPLKQVVEPMTAPSFDISSLMDLYLKNLTAMTRSWQIIAAGVATICARQQQLAATALTNEMTENLRCFLPGADPQDVMARPAAFALKALDAVIANTRDVGDMVLKSGAEAFSVVPGRIVAEVADWLSDPANSAMLADFILRKLPPALAAIDRSGLPPLVGEQVRSELQRTEIVPLAAGLLTAVVEHRRHQQLLDTLLNGLEALVSNTPAMETVRQNILAKLPSFVNLYRGEPVVMNKIIESTLALIIEIRIDPAHPVRVKLDGYLTEFIERLRSSPNLAHQVDTLKLDLLERPELADLAARAWNGLRDFLVRDAQSHNSQLRPQLEAMLAGAASLRSWDNIDSARSVA